MLIACANLSNLLLARSSTRQREVAVRLALGAARWRIARHLLAEVALLAVAGLGAGLLLAQAGLPLLVRAAPAQLSLLGVTAAINFRVLGLAAMFAIGSAMPRRAAAGRPVDAYQSPGRSEKRRTWRHPAGRVPLRLRHSLIVAEIALFGHAACRRRSLRPQSGPASERGTRLRSAQCADHADHGPAGEVSWAPAVNEFFPQWIAWRRRLASAPCRWRRSFLRKAVFSTAFRLDSMAAPDESMPMSQITAASSEHFATLGVPLVAGRTFATTDRNNSPRVAIVNQAFVSKFLPGGSARWDEECQSDHPIGRRHRWRSSASWPTRKTAT